MPSSAPGGPFPARLQPGSGKGQRIHLLLASASFFILPVYAVIDMIETALNVWSDSCVVNIVNKEVKDKLPEVTEEA